MAANDYQEENIQSDNPGGAGAPRMSKLMRGMDIFGSLFALNIAFVISCIPIITIGAAFTALYAMMFKIQRKDDYTVVREYFQEFRSNFKRGTIAWLIIVMISAILWAQYTYVCNFEGGMVSFYSVALVVEGILFALVLPFIFPLLAYFDNTVGNTFKNAFFLAVSNLGSWIKMFIAWFAVIAFSFGYEIIILNTWYLWLLLMFALLAYGTSLTARKVFDRVAVMQEEKKEAETSKEKKKEAELSKEKKAEISKGKKKKAEPVKRSIKEKQALVAALGETEPPKEETLVEETEKEDVPAERIGEQAEERSKKDSEEVTDSVTEKNAANREE